MTYRQPHFIKPLLSCNKTNWEITVDTLGGGSGSTLDYHGFVLKKAKLSATKLKE